MKATGITRRIDDLGRIVIPKEIRKSMRIKEGDPLEVYIDTQNEMVCFKRVGQEDVIDELQAIKDYIFDRYDTWDSENGSELKIIAMAFEEIKMQLRNIDEKE